MAKLNFEKDLSHQLEAVESVTKVFEEMIPAVNRGKAYSNPVFDWKSNSEYRINIRSIQTHNNIEVPPSFSNILDIKMETGTGKTFTYAKTIFELNKMYGIFKFVIVVPTLAIKAGTINFLNSDNSRFHFKVKEKYNKTINLNIVESQKSNNKKKEYFPSSVSAFVQAENIGDQIQVLVINRGMLNSKTMKNDYDRALFDKYSNPFDAIASTNVFCIVDEPHKFSKDTSWGNMMAMKPQFVIRYGATFPTKTKTEKNPVTKRKEKKEVEVFDNLLYELNAIESFNRNLVKGINGHIVDFQEGQNVLIKLTDIVREEASFTLKTNKKKKNFKLVKRDSFGLIHKNMANLFIEGISGKANNKVILLSNGLELRKGAELNPYSYDSTLQEMMVQKVIKNHFKLERELLTRNPRIKPLTLFFIDNINTYRNEDDKSEESLRIFVENLMLNEINELLKTEKNKFYRDYLIQSKENISKMHGGYFSKDNSSNSEETEKELNEILIDKEKLLSIDNPRRFIFSKWTLKEGWDNPNVFQICKLRSSGSETSKLQEVGRGLRLPVNEYGNREKDEQFYLEYYVDFTENDFIRKLAGEINEKSGIQISENEDYKMLTDEMIQKICAVYKKDPNELLEFLDNNNIINRYNEFKENGLGFIKKNFPNIFGKGIDKNKIRNSGERSNKITVRTAQYPILKQLWEALNEKVILEYKFQNEKEFESLFTRFLIETKDELKQDKIQMKTESIYIDDDVAVVQEESSLDSYDSSFVLKTLSYSDFIKQLAGTLNINLKTIHNSIKESGIVIDVFLNPRSIRVLKDRFNYFLMANAISNFGIEYKKVSNQIHPTKLTNENGEPLLEVDAPGFGENFSHENVSGKFLLENLYYDSDIEKQNIKEEIKDVEVFTKIPSRSIRIPVAGGKSYSPDFAYVINYKNGEKKLNFIVESKGVKGSQNLRNEEKFKIEHAKQFFKNKIDIKFVTQFEEDKIIDLINKSLGS